MYRTLIKIQKKKIFNSQYLQSRCNKNYTKNIFHFFITYPNNLKMEGKETDLHYKLSQIEIIFPGRSFRLQ